MEVDSLRGEPVADVVEVIYLEVQANPFVPRRFGSRRDPVEADRGIALRREHPCVVGLPGLDQGEPQRADVEAERPFDVRHIEEHVVKAHRPS